MVNFSSKSAFGDRMIPVRDKNRFEILSTIQSPTKNNDSPTKVSSSLMNNANEEQSPSTTEKINSPARSSSGSSEKKMYSALLKNELLGMDITSIDQLDDNLYLCSPTKSVSRKLFDYSSPVKNTSTARRSLFNSSKMSTSSVQLLKTPIAQERTIPQNPYKMLDAPELADDFYLNLIHWSSQDCLAVGLGSAIYIWEASTSNVLLLSDLSESNDAVTSVMWNETGDLLAVGTRRGNSLGLVGFFNCR